MKKFLRLFILLWFIVIIFSSCKHNQKVDMSNPFFSEYETPFGVPPFDKIKASHYMPAFHQGMAEGRRELESLLKSKDEPTFENTIVAYDNIGDLLTKVSSVF